MGESKFMGISNNEKGWEIDHRFKSQFSFGNSPATIPVIFFQTTIMET